MNYLVWEKFKTGFKQIGGDSIVLGDFRVFNPKYISIGNHFHSLYNMRLEALDEYFGERFHPQIVIGDNVSMNSDCHIACINKIIIGNNVLMASRVYISDHSHGEISLTALQVPPEKRSLVSKGPVVVGDNVWIGNNVCIMPGVSIGKNSIIGANAVVTKNVPENAVVAGIPAKVIKQL